MPSTFFWHCMRPTLILGPLHRSLKLAQFWLFFTEASSLWVSASRIQFLVIYSLYCSCSPGSKYSTTLLTSVTLRRGTFYRHIKSQHLIDIVNIFSPSRRMDPSSKPWGSAVKIEVGQCFRTKRTWPHRWYPFLSLSYPLAW